MLNTLSPLQEIEENSSIADRSATQNYLANLAALRQTQPRLIADVEPVAADLEWIYARDGALTGMTIGGRWWGGCSLPARAAEFMLRKADLSGTFVCFLRPAHAAQIRNALDRMLPSQALLALTPDLSTLRVMLACDNFAADILAHRLYFAWGPGWEGELDRLLEEVPGLPTPTQFIRPILADSSPADELVEPAQRIFADHSKRRSRNVRVLRGNWTRSTVRKICVVAPSHFRLWDDIGAALATAMADKPAEIDLLRFDSDDPASASPAALAAAAAQCDAIITPNTTRAELPDLVPQDMPWATWLTVPRIPPAQQVGPNDTLLLCDPAWKPLAIERGWQADRIFIATWPPMRSRPPEQDNPAAPGVFSIRPEPYVAIIANTKPLDPPERVVEYSSHRLLWEAISNELLDNPFAASESAEEYLTDRMKQLCVTDEGFDRAAFLDGVVLHAYQQGIAKLVLQEKIPLKLHGSGWEELEDFAGRAVGPVTSRDQLGTAVASAAGLIHVWPITHVHAIDSAGMPVVRPGRRRETFLRDLRWALNGRYPAITSRIEPLSYATLDRAVADFPSMR